MEICSSVIMTSYSRAPFSFPPSPSTALSSSLFSHLHSFGNLNLLSWRHSLKISPSGVSESSAQLTSRTILRIACFFSRRCPAISLWRCLQMHLPIVVLLHPALQRGTSGLSSSFTLLLEELWRDCSLRWEDLCRPR